MANWASNPYNYQSSLKTAALTHLFVDECRKFCLETDDTPVTKEIQKCLLNCRVKTSQIFGHYMLVNAKYEQNKDYKNYIDISRVTEMEVEHGHDTANSIPHHLLSNEHVHPGSLDRFNKKVDAAMGEVRRAANQ